VEDNNSDKGFIKNPFFRLMQHLSQVLMKERQKKPHFPVIGSEVANAANTREINNLSIVNKSKYIRQNVNIFCSMRCEILGGNVCIVCVDSVVIELRLAIRCEYP